MFHFRLIDLEAELLAKEQSKNGLKELSVEGSVLLDYLQREIGVKLAEGVPRDWRGWLSYRRSQQSLIVCRGRAFKEGVFGKARAGLDVANGMDSIADCKRGFDVTPPQDLDHLLINFGDGTAGNARVFLWYGENIAPYKLIFAADIDSDPHLELGEAVAEACTWIVKRPKEITLSDYLAQLSD